MEDKCVSCGAVIPEGRMVCPQCDKKVRDMIYKWDSKIIQTATAVRPEVETHCLICGEGIPVTWRDCVPKICEKCKAAVMKVREQDGK